VFQAVQSALLPRLSALAAGGRHREFRSLLFRLLALVGAVGALAIAVLTVLGPTITRLFFGHGFELSSLDFALLSASCIGFIVTQVFGYGLISIAGYRRVAVGWFVGGVVFIGVAAAGSQLFLRVELGLLCGALASSAVMAVLLLSLLRARDNLDTEPRKGGTTVHPA
jgi:O-antigen/teichoic acid export membrane protein